MALEVLAVSLRDERCRSRKNWHCGLVAQ